MGTIQFLSATRQARSSFSYLHLLHSTRHHHPSSCPRGSALTPAPTSKATTTAPTAMAPTRTPTVTQPGVPLDATTTPATATSSTTRAVPVRRVDSRPGTATRTPAPRPTLLPRSNERRRD